MLRSPDETAQLIFNAFEADTDNYTQLEEKLAHFEESLMWRRTELWNAGDANQEEYAYSNDITERLDFLLLQASHNLT